MQQFFVYILKCADNSYYVGSTSNLEQRILDHSAKKFGGYTSTRLPVKLEWSTTCSSRTEALIFEKKIKKWSRIKKLSLIEGKFDIIATQIDPSPGTEVSILSPKK